MTEPRARLAYPAKRLSPRIRHRRIRRSALLRDLARSPISCGATAGLWMVVLARPSCQCRADRSGRWERFGQRLLAPLVTAVASAFGFGLPRFRSMRPTWPRLTVLEVS